MPNTNLHAFHIPVMGLAFTIDTPLKVAHFGISSVISIMDDELIEKMREFHCHRSGEPYIPITNHEVDHRALRITAYLNLVAKLVAKHTEELKGLPFGEGNTIDNFFELLPDDSTVKTIYKEMRRQDDPQTKNALQEELRKKIIPGSIDVNIMSKVDKLNYSKKGEPLPREYSDALSALRGFANSKLQTAVVFSAGYNPRLYNYIEQFNDFIPDEAGLLKKRVILKVSDYRSALTQGKIFAKKGIWISEFRIESGLNCGGHAFATEGLLLGPILEEFKRNRHVFAEELYAMCQTSLRSKKRKLFVSQPEMKITVQGGVGTSNENKFLRDYYNVDSVGWGSPFLLVPEVTNVDEETLQKLAQAKKEDYYLSEASPLGVPFYNFRKSSSQVQRLERIQKHRPGSPCYKKLLCSNTEFTKTPICTASRQYQNLKIKQLKEKGLTSAEYVSELNSVFEKDCLCEGLGAAALLKNGIPLSHHLKAVTICPGPNLAYFSGIYTLKQMVDHIYGRVDLLNNVSRSNMFVNELNLYIEYYDKQLSKSQEPLSPIQVKHFQAFQVNLVLGINYYKKLLMCNNFETEKYLKSMKSELNEIENGLNNISASYNLHRYSN